MHVSKHGRGLDRPATRATEGLPDVRWFVEHIPPSLELGWRDLQEFMRWVSELDEGAARHFRHLTELSGHVRLVKNLTSLMRLLVHHTVREILTDGLTTEENDALRSLERPETEEKYLGIAHALLNIEERCSFLKAFGELFRDLRTRRDGYLNPSPLRPQVGD